MVVSFFLPVGGYKAVLKYCPTHCTLECQPSVLQFWKNDCGADCKCWSLRRQNKSIRNDAFHQLNN